MTKRRHKSFDWHGISQRFSLRKYHFGAASVLLGTAVILGAAAGATSVSADTTSALVSPSTLEPTPSTDQATIEQPTAPAAQSSETPAQALSQPVPAPQSVAPEAQTPHLAPIAKAGLVFSTSLTPEDFLTNSADLKAQGATISFTDGQPSPDATSVSLKVVYRDGTERLLQIPVILEKRSVDILVAEQVQPISEATELEVNVDQTETETTPGKKRVKRALTNPKNQTNLPYFNVATKEILKESIQKALPNDSNHPEYYKDGLKFGHSFTDSGKIGIGEEDKENQYTFSYYNRYNEKVTFKLISTTMPQKEASFANAVQIDGAAGHSKHTASTTHYQEYAKNALIETGGRGESVYEINIEGREKLGLVALRPYLPVNYATSYQKMEVKFSHANILAVGLHNLPRDNFYFEEKKIDGLESSELYTTPVAKNTEDGVEFVAHSMDTHDLRYGASPEEKKEFLQTKKESNKNLSQDSVAVLTNSPTIRMTVKKVQSTTLNSIERYDALKRTGYDSVQSPEYQYDIFLGLNGGVWNRLELSDKVNVKNASNLSESEKETIIQAIKNSDYIKKKGNYSGVRRIVVTQEGDAQLIFHPDYKTIVIPKESLITESPALEVPVIAPIDSDDRTISITLKTEATDKSQVVVTIDDVPVEADKISVVGTDVTVTLDRPLTAGQTVGVVQSSPTQKDSPKAVAQVAKTASETAQDGKKDPVKVPVKDATNVSEDEKAKIKEAIKVAYPNLPGTETIDVNQDGSARITFVDGSAPIVIPGKDTVRQILTSETHTPVAPADKVAVANPADLTQDEKDKVKAAVTASNPGLPANTTITVGKDGSVTITYPDGSSNTIPGKETVRQTLTSETHTPVAPADKVAVANPADLTQDEKDKVKVAVTASNPGLPANTTITVGKDGSVTITYPDGSSNTMPGKDTVRQILTSETHTPVAPADKVAVANPADLTQEEKDKVKAVVTASNPGLPVNTTITVGKDGSVTITYPDGSSNTIPGKDTVRQILTSETHTPVAPADKVAVANPADLTQDEKDKVKAVVTASNPGLPANTTITVGKDGSVTITYPDGSSNTIPGKDTVRQIVIAMTVTPSPESKTPVVEGQPITPRPAVVVNKPNAVITGTQTNGITVDGTGNLTGTPVITDWTLGEEERLVNIPVSVTVGHETQVIKVPVTIERDTDKDGIPDKIDNDDDNDGIPDAQDKNPKMADALREDYVIIVSVDGTEQTATYEDITHEQFLEILGAIIEANVTDNHPFDLAYESSNKVRLIILSKTQKGESLTTEDKPVYTGPVDQSRPTVSRPTTGGVALSTGETTPVTPTSYQPVVNYAPVDTLSIKHKAKEATLPSTGETNSSLLAAYGALGLIAGLGLVARKKRRDDEA